MPTRQPIWRVTDRATFLAFRRGRRARRGPVTVTWVAPATGDDAVRVAYAIGRSSGGAVTRNRIRRRLRAAVREIHAGTALPAGSYLVGATSDAAETPWSELVSDLADAVRAAGSGAA